MNGIIEGYGSYGIIYSNPRLPYSIKYKFHKKSFEDFLEEPFPYIEENISEVNKENYENDNFLKYEASKVFYDNKCYEIELGEYTYILNNYNIPDEYFNKPLNYGSINKKYIIDNIKKFDYVNNKINKKEIYYTYLNAEYQITFLKGVNLDKIDIYNNFKKTENILHAIKFMNENNLILDDLKKDNIIIVDGKMKFCDFSSIINISDLNLNTLEKLNLKTIFYYIHNPILNILLCYYISIKENNIIIDNILNNIKINERNIQNIDYIEYNKDLINKIYNFSKKLDKSNNIGNIFKNIYFYVDKNIKNKDYYKIIILKFIEYFNNKYEDNTQLKIVELISRINIYSLGIVFLQYIDLYIDQNEKHNKIFFKNLFEIYKLCSLQFNIFKNNNINNENSDNKSDNKNDNNIYRIINRNIDYEIDYKKLDIINDYKVDVIEVDIKIIINKFNEIEC
jgi:hypothetical protein